MFLLLEEIRVEDPGNKHLSATEVRSSEENVPEGCERKKCREENTAFLCITFICNLKAPKC